MRIQGKQSRIFRQAYYLGKGPQCMLCHDMPTSQEAMAKQIEFLHDMDN